MSFASVVVLSTPFLLQNSISIQSGAIDQQAVSRDCALNVANITGNVTVQNCPGIPAKAIEGLNRELRARRLSEGQARRSAEDWRQKYEALQSAMASAGLSQALLKKALAYLDQGDLTQASKTLDEALTQQDQQVMEAASTHYYRAKVAELDFDPKTEGKQLDAAYRLAPHAVIIATEYGNFLTKYGRLTEAESVFDKLLDESKEANALAVQAATLINDSGALRYEGRLSEAKEKLLESASLWGVCSKNHEKNSLSNEAAALSGAASIAMLQQHFEEATGLIAKAIGLYRTNLITEERTSSAAAAQLGLAKALLASADLFAATGDLDSAFSAAEEASGLTKENFPIDLANRAKGILGDAKTSQCFVTALRHSPESAQKYCDEALSILGPMKAVKGDNLKGDLAQALFISGMVEEDRKSWSQALSSFKQAESLWAELIETGQSQYVVDRAKAAFYCIGAAYYSGDHDATIQIARHAVLLTAVLPSQYINFHRQVLTEAASVLGDLGNPTEAAEIIRKRAELGSASK